MAEKNAVNQALGATARWTAAARAAESAREDRLFFDPWAQTLAGAEGMAWLQQRGGNVSSMVIRTRYFDDFLQGAVAGGSIRQVVILAAGLDTRAYRMEWPAGTRMFELDRPEVLLYKQQVLDEAGAQPACERTPVGVDLTGQWQETLLAAGYEPGSPSVWLLEGILFYLPPESIDRVLQQASDLAALGSRLGFDTMNSVTLTSPLTRPWIEMQANAGAPWLGWLDDPEAALAGLGWQAALTQLGAPDAHFERWTLPVLPLKMPNMPHSWYVTAVKC